MPAGALTYRERKLYHQVHPAKLLTDVGVTPIAIWFLWRHEVWPAVAVAFVPPVLVSLVMIRWAPASLDRIAASRAGAYLRRSMTPGVEAVRFLALVPVAYGAWRREWWWIVLGVVIVAGAWGNGWIDSGRRGGAG